MPASNETFPLGTAESILIDGANGMSGAPRQHFPEARVSAGLALLAALLFLVLLRRHRRGAVLGLLVAGALPGLYCLVVLRGDAPTRRPALAAAIGATLTGLEARAPWPSAKVRVVREDDDVLFPLGRYALPERRTDEGPAVELELRGALLGQGCHEDEATGHVVCGAGP